MGPSIPETKTKNLKERLQIIESKLNSILILLNNLNGNTTLELGDHKSVSFYLSDEVELVITRVSPSISQTNYRSDEVEEELQ